MTGTSVAGAWEPVIGLEIHVQLKTRTKMFCRCENVWGEEPNTRTCPVCLALPGSLPVPNRTAIEWTVKLGLALGCRIAERAIFARKHYFYQDSAEGVPDLPVRGAALPGRALRRSRRGRRPRDRDRPCAPRGGRREDDPRRRRRWAHPRRRDVARRLQPGRHAPRRDRLPAGPPFGGRGEALPAAPAPDGRRARHLGRRDGEGLAALRRQRLGSRKRARPGFAPRPS